MEFSDVCAAYLSHLSTRSSYPQQARLYRQFFASWREHPTKQQIVAWHAAHANTPAHANKGVKFLRSAYNHARKLGYWSDPNPAAGISRHKTYSRERIMAGYEVKALVGALDFVILKVAAFLVLLMTTACRMSEARAMQWRHVDLDNGCWFKPTTKNGQPQRVPLPRQTCDVLRSLPRSSVYVFPGLYGHPWSRTAAEKSWASLRKLIRLEDVTLHDFRRTVASRLYAQEKDLMLVKAVLNHYDGSPTSVYVRLQYDTLASALQRHADDLFGVAPSSRVARSSQQDVVNL